LTIVLSVHRGDILGPKGGLGALFVWATSLGTSGEIESRQIPAGRSVLTARANAVVRVARREKCGVILWNAPAMRSPQREVLAWAARQAGLVLQAQLEQLDTSRCPRCEAPGIVRRRGRSLVEYSECECLCGFKGTAATVINLNALRRAGYAATVDLQRRLEETRLCPFTDSARSRRTS
jgi:hypothetical protein